MRVGTIILFFDFAYSIRSTVYLPYLIGFFAQMTVYFLLDGRYLLNVLIRFTAFPVLVQCTVMTTLLRVLTRYLG